MANDGQNKKVRDTTPTGSERPVDVDVEEDNCNEDQNHGVKDVGQEGNVPKKTDQSGYYNEGNLQV
ncbi:hypothetical protein ACSBR2_005487 [Camellia fascicularis]